MEYVVRGIPVYYEDIGAGRPVLILHDCPGDHHLMMYNPETLAEFRAAVKPGFKAADRAILERLDGDEFRFSFAVDELPAPFPAPTLILAGRQDSLVGYRNAWGLLDNYPRGTFVTLDRVGHAVAAEQRALFRALVSEWLDRVSEYAGRSDSR